MTLSRSVLPTHYDISLIFDIVNLRYIGTSVISFKVNSPSNFAELHASSPLSDIQISQGDTILSHTETPPLLRIFSEDFTIPITISFSGRISEDTLGICTYNRRSFSTQFQADHARRAFPCFDEPDVRSTFKFSLTIPADLCAVTNAPLESRVVVDGLATCVFATTPLIPACLVALAADFFECCSSETARNLPVRVYAVTHGLPTLLRRMEWFASETAQVIDYFEDYFGIPLPLSAMHVAIVTDFHWIGMENFGLVILSSLNSSHDPLVHEIVHHWAGDIAGLKVWNDIWINEGFATLFPWYYLGDNDPDFFTRTTTRVLSRVLCKDQDSILPVRLVSYATTEEIFDFTRTYLKAGLIQKMMRNYLGKENFRAAVSAYFREFYMESGGLDELVSVYSRYKDSNLLYGWITQPGFPVIILEEDGTIHQAPANHPLEKDGRNWIVPIDVRYENEEEVVDTQVIVRNEPLQFVEGARWVCLNFTLETPCRVWHKGTFHYSIVSAIRERKIPKRVVDRIRDDLTVFVKLGAAPESMLVGLPVSH
jgi:aminopeptidase N